MCDIHTHPKMIQLSLLTCPSPHIPFFCGEIFKIYSLDNLRLFWAFYFCLVLISEHVLCSKNKYKREELKCNK